MKTEAGEMALAVLEEDLGLVPSMQIVLFWPPEKCTYSHTGKTFNTQNVFKRPSKG